MLRNLVKSGLALGLSKCGTLGLLGRRRRSRDAPLIVGYHRVVRDFERSARTSIPSMLISAQMLEKQLDWLGGHYRLVSLEEMGKCLEAGSPTAGTAAVTFDDGYGDVYENAFPILMRKGIPATVFVVSGTIGTSSSLDHDRLYALLGRALSGVTAPADVLAGLYRDCSLRMPEPRTLVRAGRTTFSALRLFLDTFPRPVIQDVIARLEARFGTEGIRGGLALTWEMIDEMRAAGVMIGSHTESHPLLTHESQERRRDEIFGSRRTLEAHLKTDVHHIAYPDGRFDHRTLIAATGAGYRFGYTTCAHRDPLFPLLTLPRRVLWERACVDARGAFSGAVMDCLVSGVFDVLSPCRQTHSTPIGGGRHLGAARSGTTP